MSTGEELQNVHGIAIPIRERHTEENIFDAIRGLLNAFTGAKWLQKLVDMRTDGALSMVGRVSGAVTRFE